MAFNKHYIESSTLRDTAEQLHKIYYTHLGHVILDSIYFADIVGEKPPKAKVLEMKGVSSEWLKEMLSQENNTKLYCLAAWEDAWAEVDWNFREWLIFEALYSIHPDCNGKLRKPIVQGFGFIEEFNGIYWKSGLSKLPGLLSGGNALELPPPLLDISEAEPKSNE